MSEESIYEWSQFLILPYSQKSLNLLFPLLGISKDDRYEPSTYLFWVEGEESIFNYELLVLYENEEGFEKYENEIILPHPMLKNCYSVEHGLLYVFDIITFLQDIFLFLEGKYSKMSKEAKKLILNYHGDLYTGNEPIKGHAFHAVFNPDIYRSVIRKELNCSMEALKAHGEVWDRYDKQLETYGGKLLEDCNCTEIKRIQYII